MASSLERFFQLKHALEDRKTTFELGDASDFKRFSCMVYKYGDCNLIYGLDVWHDETLPPPNQLERPELIAISDDDGKDIAVIEDYVFRVADLDYELNVEVVPYLIKNQIAAMNKRLSSAIVEPYKNRLKIDAFPKDSVLEDAKYLARIAEVNGTPIIDYYNDIVDESDYYCIRNGSLNKEDVARRYCEKNKYTLVTDKIAEELLEQGVLDETQAALAKMLRELGENAKAVTLVFEKDGARVPAKITPQSLQDTLKTNGNVLTSYQFKNGKEYDNVINTLFGDPKVYPFNALPEIYDIESVTYGKQTLYTREVNKAVAKEKKRTDTYER